jgi:low affinity Fe/Cu permease
MLIGIEHLTEDEISEIRDKCEAHAKKAGTSVEKHANKKARAAIDKAA